MDLRKMRFPQSKPLNSPLLYWCFDYTTETTHRESLVYNQSIDILDDLINSENIEMLPDPTVHVIGVIFDKPELEAAGLEERSLSPSSVNRSKVRKDEDDTYMNTPRTINLPNTTRETSVEANSLREKAEAYSKEKNKGRITTITNKYMKPKEISANDFQLKSGNQVANTSRVDQSGSATKMNNSYLANQNKFSLNLSAVRRVSGQAKQVPTSGREKDSMDMAGISGTLYSERRKNLDNPSNNLNKLSTRANRYVQEKKPKPDESGRDDSNSLVMTSAVRRKDITSAMGIRIKKQ